MSAYTELVFAPMLIIDVFDVARQAPAWLNTNAAQSGVPRHPHVTNTALGNMVSGFISTQSRQPNPGNAIAVGIDTQVVSYQPVAFYGGTKVLELRSHHLNADNAPILVSSLRNSIEKFSWGYKASAARLKKTRIMVPVTVDVEGNTVVDWDGMTRLGRELSNEARRRSRVTYSTGLNDDTLLPELTFEPMLITDVVDTMKASAAWYDKTKLISNGEAKYPFVSRTRSQNSIDGFCARQTKSPEPGNAITIGLDTQTIAYQPVPFYTSQNIQVLRHHQLDEFNALVLTALLQEQMSKFSWGGNGATLGRLRKTRFLTPVITNSSGDLMVDWEGMTAYGYALRARVEHNIQSVLQPITMP